MQTIEQALNEVRTLHEQLTHSPAPEIGPQAFLPIPAGHDPVSYAIGEVVQLKQLIEATRAGGPAVQGSNWVPRASVFGSDSGLTFLVEIPGVGRDSVEVAMAGNELAVRGTRRPTSVSEGMKPLVVEQVWGSFERRFPLPPWAHQDRITARCCDGVLEIVLTRGEQDGNGEFQVEIG